MPPHAEPCKESDISVGAAQLLAQSVMLSVAVPPVAPADEEGKLLAIGLDAEGPEGAGASAIGEDEEIAGPTGEQAERPLAGGGLAVVLPDARAFATSAAISASVYPFNCFSFGS